MKVHFGCGNKFMQGYVHVDCAKYPHVDYVSDSSSLEMFEDESLNLIYASHVFEYFDRTEAATVLADWFRKLKLGGIVRLAVPNIDMLISTYQATNDLNSILGPLYGKWENPSGAIYHKTVYNFASLKSILEDAQFSKVQGWKWQDVFTGELEGFDDYSQAYYPHMDKEHGILISLNVEASK